MADSSLDGAPHKPSSFVAQQRRSLAQQRPPVEATSLDESDGRAWSAPSSATVSSSAVNPLDSLVAFLNAREEDAVGLLSTFTQLTEQDKLKALARLEGGTLSSDDNERDSTQQAHADGVGQGPVKSDGELRRRLQERERQQQERAVRRHVDVHHLVGKHIGREGASFTKHHPSLVAEEAEMEVVELEEGTRTGNLVAFFDKGVTNVSTSFDNFFGTEAALSSSTGAKSDAVKPLLAALLPRQTSELAAPSPGFSLDELLALDDVTDAKVPSGTNTSDALVVASRPMAEVTADANIPDFPNASSSSSASFALSSLSSVELPGLDGNEEGVAAGVHLHEKANDGVSYTEGSRATPSAEVKTSDAFAADVAEGLHRVIAEHDDCVHTFALDPLFDYDADVLGEAFRSKQRWRQ